MNTDSSTTDRGVSPNEQAHIRKGGTGPGRFINDREKLDFSTAEFQVLNARSLA